ncbi:MAG: S8 family serine peptidase [Dehalococcoidaceae bacterium]|nr:S8 family serine peptidase [Dehalococcoidaceae bacterium]
MKKIVFILFSVMLVLGLMIPSTLFAKPNLPEDIYIVIMSSSPAIAYEGGIDGFAPTKPAEGSKINPNSALVKQYERFLEKEHNKAIEAVGVSTSEKIYDYTMSLNGFAVALNVNQVAEIAKQPGVAMVLKDQMRYKTTDNSPDFLGLTDPGGPWMTGYDGENVVVGIIDTGIWPEHPSFADDGSYDPLPGYEGLDYEFGNTDHNPNDAPYDGSDNDKLLGAYQMLETYRYYIGADPDEFDSARDDDGHGTHTASTAAGNAGVEASIQGVSYGTVSGIAPRARIIAYKALGNLGGYTSDLAAAIEQAVTDGVDVINYSIGGGAGTPGADDIAFLFAADAGVFVATSAGNSGPGASTVGSPGNMPWITTVGASTQNRTFQGSVVLGDGMEYFGASITAGTEMLPIVDAADLGNELCNPYRVPIFDEDITGKIVLAKRGTYARVEKSLAVFLAGGAGMILYNTSDSQDTNTDTHWVPTVHTNYTDGLTIKSYIASEGSSATAQIFGGEYTEIDAPWMASFSSRGPNPTSGDIIKPDITAPGVNILAGASPFPDPGFVPGELFQAIGGTSMSSPHIAGVFALIKQAHPEWSAAMAKSALMTTASQDVMKEDGMTPADPFDMGSGHVNAGGKAIKGSIFEPGLVYDAGLFEYAAFTCGMDWGVFTPGSCAFLESIGVPMEPYNLNYPSIGVAELPGSITVKRTVTSVAEDKGWRTYEAAVDAPVGYEVTVSPSTLVLKSGQSATFEVTITNVSAPAGEWRFGSLTWVDKDKNNHYEVYSPIAVKGAMFAAPAEINGCGEDGTISFDVSFGYSGSYSAAAHGLEPATVTSDNVLQDPDQTFDPGDGYSNLHQFNLSGAAFLRIAMPPFATEADADLDIFVFGPGGEEYSSTSGGTNELIDILLPADGTWNVYIHGWSAPGGDSDYDLYTWVISATPGGNLTVDSAPASATLGATETINVSWTGATDGQWHLGAVSHTGDSGLMGLTLININNILPVGG